ncbi:hypothetical protein PUN28_016296 [Cardiocondyla obscurior]|uniref:Uncharacterized protein n=1 Tax=Cardiocondyla obscurior TaxID=286306 RepID=A0AAW2EW61_9HYME
MLFNLSHIFCAALVKFYLLVHEKRKNIKDARFFKYRAISSGFLSRGFRSIGRAYDTSREETKRYLRLVCGAPCIIRSGAVDGDNAHGSRVRWGLGHHEYEHNGRRRYRLLNWSPYGKPVRPRN